MCPNLSGSDENLSVGSESESSSGIQPMSVSSPEGSDTNIKTEDFCRPKSEDSDPKFATKLLSVDGGKNGGTGSPYHRGNPATRSIIESEPDSVVSDYSEMAEPLKEHLANVQIIQQDDLRDGNTMVSTQFSVQAKIPREDDETDEEYAKRLRKINYLSLAQEFAELKKIDSEALPFNLHKSAQIRSPVSDSTDTEASSTAESSEASAAATPLEGTKDFIDNNLDQKSRMAVDPTHSIGETHRMTTDSVRSNTKMLNSTKPRDLKDYGPLSKGSASETVCQTEISVSQIPASIKNNIPAQSSRGQSSCPRTGSLEGQDPSMATPNNSRVTSMGDFDVYNIETTLPQMDWTLLEEQLRKAAEEEEQKKQVRISKLFAC